MQIYHEREMVTTLVMCVYNTVKRSCGLLKHLTFSNDLFIALEMLKLL